MEGKGRSGRRGGRQGRGGREAGEGKRRNFVHRTSGDISFLRMCSG